MELDKWKSAKYLIVIYVKFDKALVVLNNINTLKQKFLGAGKNYLFSYKVCLFYIKLFFKGSHILQDLNYDLVWNTHSIKLFE